MPVEAIASRVLRLTRSIVLTAELPTNALPTAISQESKQRPLLVSIQRFDGLLQAALRRLFSVGRQRIIDSRRPAFFFESRQDHLLIDCGHLEPLDYRRPDGELLSIAVPFRH